MSRDDEIAVMECADGSWLVEHVMAENYPPRAKGQYASLADALLAAERMNERYGGTEYGICVRRLKKR